jgi:hypothetical protein
LREKCSVGHDLGQILLKLPDDSFGVKALRYTSPNPERIHDAQLFPLRGTRTEFCRTRVERVYRFRPTALRNSVAAETES